MKIAEGYILRQIADAYVVVPLTSPLVDFKSIISLNESGAFLWAQMEQDTTEEALLAAMLKEYDIDEATEQALLQNLQALGQKTVLLISHKPCALEVCTHHLTLEDSVLRLAQ